MKKILIIIALLSTAVFANDGKVLHNESCSTCHIMTHDNTFYTRKNRKIDTLSKLNAQVSRCVHTFSISWFPDEEKSVVEYLNNEYYQLKK